jgi:capsular polysaccharide biosynthesis protein
MNNNLQINSPTVSSIYTPLKSSDQGHVSSISKIQQIEPYVSEGRFTFICLRNLYRKYLKHYSPVRSTAIWAWKNFYPLYLNLKSIHLSNSIIRKAKRWRPLTNLCEFSKKRGLVAYKIADTEVVNTPVPTAIPAADQSYLVSPHDQYAFPEISVAIAEDATIYGGSNLTLVDNDVVCHDLFDATRDFTSEELHGRALIDPKRKRIRWLSYDKEPTKLSTAATFVDACASNYAHWLTEVLPRIALFCTQERYKEIPIVINDGLHENILNSLFEVIGSRRKVIALPIGRAIIVNKLFITSVAGYVPFERRTNKLTGHSHGKFSPKALKALRSYFDSIELSANEEEWPEKIFFRRNSGTRKIVGSDGLEIKLVAQGFVIVETESLTFLQQVQLAKNAKKIIAPTGAALANAIFCQPGTSVIVFMGKHEDMIYRYWANILSPLGIKVTYVLGNIVGKKSMGIHGDFFVHPDSVTNMLEAIT